MSNATRPTALLVLAVVLGLSATACRPAQNDGKAALQENQAIVSAKLKRLSAIAAEVKQARSPAEGARLRNPSERLLLCAYNNAGYHPRDRTGPIDDPGECNTAMISLDWLLDWRTMCRDSVGGETGYERCRDNTTWTPVRWYVEMASLAETGGVAFDHDPKATDYLVEWALQRFLPIRYVLVVREHDVFLYEIDGARAFGATHVEPSNDGEIVDYVHADGPNQGKVAYSVDTFTYSDRDDMNQMLLQQLTDVVVSSPN